MKYHKSKRKEASLDVTVKNLQMVERFRFVSRDNEFADKLQDSVLASYQKICSHRRYSPLYRG